jgi:hypothetical protein
MLDSGGFRAGVLLLAAQFPAQSHGEVLRTVVEAAVAAERAGFDDVWFAEHHFMSYGVCPSAATLAAYVLGHTPEQCVALMTATIERTGIRHLLCMVEGAGDRGRTLENIARLGAEVLPSVRRAAGLAGQDAAAGTA